jgi:RimJ/RimL family protein N-acetyltransferase
MFSRDHIDDAFIIETERLVLRWPRLSDAGAIERLAGDKAVAEMTALIPHPYPRGAAAEFILAARIANAEGSALALVVTRRTPPGQKAGELMGAVGAHCDAAANPVVEPFIGYWFGRSHWGRGFATEAARAVVDALFEDSRAAAITAGVRVVNGASRRVLEKCGFRHEGSGLVAFPARGGLFPVDHMRLDRRTWASFKAWRPAHVSGRPLARAQPG